jgi:uncharacterized protein (DUF1810 family)
MMGGVTASDPHNLQRFIDAQHGTFETALAEIERGAKESHWMWFVFPQLAGLGRSATAQHYGVRSLDEAKAYLADPTLGPRLERSLQALLPWAAKRSAGQIFGSLDAIKLRSSLTLFDSAAPGQMFGAALDSFFGGERDERTLALLNGER